MTDTINTSLNNLNNAGCYMSLFPGMLQVFQQLLQTPTPVKLCLEVERKRKKVAKRKPVKRVARNLKRKWVARNLKRKWAEPREGRV